MYRLHESDQPDCLTIHMFVEKPLCESCPTSPGEEVYDCKSPSKVMTIIKLTSRPVRSCGECQPLYFRIIYANPSRQCEVPDVDSFERLRAVRMKIDLRERLNKEEVLLVRDNPTAFYSEDRDRAHDLHMGRWVPERRNSWWADFKYLQILWKWGADVPLDAEDAAKFGRQIRMRNGKVKRGVFLNRCDGRFYFTIASNTPIAINWTLWNDFTHLARPRDRERINIRPKEGLERDALGQLLVQVDSY